MTILNPVLKASTACLAHVPDLVRHGSKPRREIRRDGSLDGRIARGLRSFQAAASYPPNRVFVGELDPDSLVHIPRPWYEVAKSASPSSSTRSFGRIITQNEFYALIKQADVLHPPLFELTDWGCRVLAETAAKNSLPVIATRLQTSSGSDSSLHAELSSGLALPILSEGRLIGGFRADNRAEGAGDSNLSAPHLLEALCSKASAAFALNSLLGNANLLPDQIDFLISCGEEACGDRYQRGGGGMAKAVGEMAGCLNASGVDVKNFCAAPASALVMAGSLVMSGICDRVAVVAGGSLAKLGMKFQALLRTGKPMLEDCIASMAFLVTRDDGCSPVLRLDRGGVGLATIGSSTSDEAVYRKLIIEPLDALGLKMSDIDKFAPELHNPEIMQFAGSGDVAQKNYRTIAAMAVMSGQLAKSDMPDFIRQVGMPGFAPTQGHIPSAVPFIGHAARAMTEGRMQRAMFLCKASLFLNRITHLFDGVSFVLEKNPST